MSVLELRRFGRRGTYVPLGEAVINGQVLDWNKHLYNHFDNGCWIDVVQFAVPMGCLREGSNSLRLHRTVENAGFDGAIEVRKFILDQSFATGFSPGRLD